MNDFGARHPGAAAAASASHAALRRQSPSHQRRWRKHPGPWPRAANRSERAPGWASCHIAWPESCLRHDCFKEPDVTEQVLILGGGYAGAYAALGAARARGNAGVEIVLVSAEPDFVIRPRLYESDPG